MRFTAWSRSDEIHGCISQSQAVNRLPKSQYVAGFVVFDALSQDENRHTKTTFFKGQTL
jgi:hypothetical protein